MIPSYLINKAIASVGIFLNGGTNFLWGIYGVNTLIFGYYFTKELSLVLSISEDRFAKYSLCSVVIVYLPNYDYVGV